MIAESELREFAPAKVNLALHVVGRRADGYHLLDSLVAFAGVGDVLPFRAADRLDLTLSGPGAQALAAESNNIVLRAAHRLAEAAGIVPRAAIILDKRLPVASGIGGGSADAAAALRGLTRLWSLRLTDSEMAAVALGLGADVPVCLFGHTAILGGIGERIEAAPPLPPGWLVLVNPGQPLSTPAVFRARAARYPDGNFRPSESMTQVPVDIRAFATVLGQWRNDLTEAACALVPEIETVITALGRQPGCLLARMSGSGATSFGLFADEAAADAAARRLQSEQPRWWTVAAPLLGEPR
ncbi:MAG: 4-(cytidine 5'-diphospho)-2-C-methyl-D-erythritol kinase [Alphaproteobacteria bacterium]|nr:4-(cytidine 5'-diphospho)-2-C-methyl-D-erythritol kinase [Alphaproteobacteria bacterium]